MKSRVRYNKKQLKSTSYRIILFEVTYQMWWLGKISEKTLNKTIGTDTGYFYLKNAYKNIL